MAEKPRIVVIGAGPAGMMLAHQLVSAGVSVHVLERHADFEREFRGELIGPSVLPVLEELGLMKKLLDRELARTGVERRMLVGKSRHVTLPTGGERGALISQPGFLALLHEECSRHPSYRLDFGRSATRVVRQGGRAIAVDTKDGRVEGDLFVLCNGRNNKLRRDLDVALDLDESPDDTLWLRFDLSEAKDALPAGVDVHMFGRGVVLVLFATTRSRLQVAYSAPGNVAALRKDYPALKEALLPLLSDRLREIVAPKIDDTMESQILRVAIDRVARWHAPGLLMLGDAAHTMGPAAAQGLNLALRDAIVAANHLLAAVEAEKPLDATVLAAIEAERRPEIEASQAIQLRAYGGVKKPLFVLHLMFSILGIVMRFKKFAPPPMPAVAPRRLSERSGVPTLQQS